MFKKLLFSSVLLCFALSANAQIATPLFDPGFPTISAAATGWEQNSSASLIYVDVEGDIELETPAAGKIGTIKAGSGAVGPEDKETVLPAFNGTYKNESFAVELYTGLGGGLKTDVDTEVNGLLCGHTVTEVCTTDIFIEESTTKLHLSYLLRENLSLGFGYRSVDLKQKTVKALYSSGAFQGDSIVESEEKATGMSILASWKLADMFYLAGGMETVSASGTYTDATGDQDIVANSWTNMIYGFGFQSGEPGDTQFRAEYSVVQSPESVKEETGKKSGEHPKTTLTYTNLETKFGNFMLSYQIETEQSIKIDGTTMENGSDETITTNLMGIGWLPEEGLSVTAYTYNVEHTMESDTSKQVLKPSGIRLVVGWNF